MDDENEGIHVDKWRLTQRKIRKPSKDGETHPRDGHTFRFNGHHSRWNDIDQKNIVIERASPPPGQKEDEVPTTDIDRYFDASFIDPGRPRSVCHGDYRTLNTRVLDEEVEALLWEQALSARRDYTNHLGTTYVFEIPIRGHYRVSPKTDELPDYGQSSQQQPPDAWSTWRMDNGTCMKPSRRRRHQMQHILQTKQWFYWNGNYYNPQFLYCHRVDDPRSEYYRTEELIPVCRLLGREPDPHMQLGLTVDATGRTLNRIAAISFRAPRVSLDPRKRVSTTYFATDDMIMTEYDDKSKKIKWVPDTYAEIDLQKVSRVTHIGLMGGYPRGHRLFPEHGSMDIRGGCAYVSIVNYASLSWVTKFSIYYRHVETGNWINYSPRRVFAGNADLFEEVITRVDIRTRAVRIVPKTFRGTTMSMRVMVYGEGDVVPANKKIPTIQYKLHVPRPEVRVERSDRNNRKYKLWSLNDHAPVVRMRAIQRQLRHAKHEGYQDERSDPIDDMDDDSEPDVCPHASLPQGVRGESLTTQSNVENIAG